MENREIGEGSGTTGVGKFFISREKTGVSEKIHWKTLPRGRRPSGGDRRFAEIVRGRKKKCREWLKKHRRMGGHKGKHSGADGQTIIFLGTVEREETSGPLKVCSKNHE